MNCRQTSSLLPSLVQQILEIIFRSFIVLCVQLLPQCIANYSTYVVRSIKYYQLDLQIATETENLPCQGRAHGNLGMVYETLHNYKMAVRHQEQHLFIADDQNDPVAKLTALRSIGRNLLRSGSDLQRAALLLQQALLLARELGAKVGVLNYFNLCEHLVTVCRNRSMIDFAR